MVSQARRRAAAAAEIVVAAGVLAVSNAAARVQSVDGRRQRSNQEEEQHVVVFVCQPGARLAGIVLNEGGNLNPQGSLSPRKAGTSVPRITLF